ncbi:MAG: tRNA pseudouridine(55) synthase TruB [Bacteroidales bacterium]|nr:tRNA pseudouridine(55) synthase TruB [Bacteroidales bacterium]
MASFFEQHLSHDPADYPGGIVLPMDKPYRWTSADLVRKCRFTLQKQFGIRNLKVGHAGTLDPLATGLLLVCVGKATKVAEALQASEKEYVATVEFGATTPSYDLEQPVDCLYPFEHITEEAVKAVLPDFLGPQEQVPPLFSAKIINGLRAYEYARTGEPVELRTNHIEIFSITLEKFTLHNAMTGDGYTVDKVVRNIHNYHTSGTSDGTRPAATLRIRCSRGTYIRSLARDLGLALGSGGYLTALRRTASGEFRLD